MSNENGTSRRDIFRILGATAALGSMDIAAAQHVHHEVAEATRVAGGPYTPKAFTDHEYKTLIRLSELIVPADEKGPSAVDAGAPQFIDYLSSHNDELKAIYTGGIGWMDHQMLREHGTDWVSSTPAQQTALLDLIAFKKNNSPELGPGIHFFEWARKMIVDAYFTSPAGIKDVGYMGNTGMAKFSVPQSAIDYALKRSGLG